MCRDVPRWTRRSRGSCGVSRGHWYRSRAGLLVCEEIEDPSDGRAYRLAAEPRGDMRVERQVGRPLLERIAHVVREFGQVGVQPVRADIEPLRAGVLERRVSGDDPCVPEGRRRPRAIERGGRPAEKLAAPPGGGGEEGWA